MKIWIYKIYINLPTGRTLVRTARIAAENEEKIDKLFDMWYSIADRKELIDVIDVSEKT